MSYTTLHRSIFPLQQKQNCCFTVTFTVPLVTKTKTVREKKNSSTEVKHYLATRLGPSQSISPCSNRHKITFGLLRFNTGKKKKDSHPVLLKAEKTLTLTLCNSTQLPALLRATFSFSPSIATSASMSANLRLPVRIPAGMRCRWKVQSNKIDLCPTVSVHFSLALSSRFTLSSPVSTHLTCFYANRWSCWCTLTLCSRLSGQLGAWSCPVRHRKRPPQSHTQTPQSGPIGYSGEKGQLWGGAKAQKDE